MFKQNGSSNAIILAVNIYLNSSGYKLRPNTYYLATELVYVIVYPTLIVKNVAVTVMCAFDTREIGYLIRPIWDVCGTGLEFIGQDSLDFKKG